jgi:ubiquinone/menaquinone biosynthesis C-methylase UbiE
MEQEKLKQQIRQTFATICKGYDCSALQFFSNAAAHLPATFSLQGDEQVLDVATGTGIPAMALAAHLPEGAVTAVDFSRGMLEQAQAKAEAAGMDNISFAEMDMTDMALEAESFDAANCSFGLFFTPEMDKTLAHIAGKVRPGGTIVTTHFHDGSFEPLSDLFIQRLEQDYGVEVPPIGWQRLGTEQLNRELYEAAGLKEIETARYQVGYPFDSAEQWWEVVWNAGYRGLLAGLDEVQLERFKGEHLQEIAALDEGHGIPLHIEVIITRARR